MSAVVPRFDLNIEANQALFLLHGLAHNPPPGAPLAKVQVCLQLAFGDWVEQRELRFDSRLFSRLCQLVESRDGAMTGAWTEAYHHAQWLMRLWGQPDGQMTFPDGRRSMLVAELPRGYTGYVAPYESVHPGKPGLIEPGALVWAAPTALAMARLSRTDSGSRPGFELELPPGEQPDGTSLQQLELLYELSVGL